MAMFIYQVAYGTNESSYKFGYRTGKYDYPNCTLPADKSNGEIADCFGPSQCNYFSNNTIFGGVYNYTNGLYYPVSQGHVTNPTACVDRYINGWNHVCKPGAKDPDRTHVLPCPANKKTIVNVNR